MTFDFSSHKDFRMPYKENHLLQFRLEAFNALNHPVWGNPERQRALQRLRHHHGNGDLDAPDAIGAEV